MEARSTTSAWSRASRDTAGFCDNPNLKLRDVNFEMCAAKKLCQNSADGIILKAPLQSRTQLPAPIDSPWTLLPRLLHDRSAFF
jgi:hypothetical protein